MKKKLLNNQLLLPSKSARSPISASVTVAGLGVVEGGITVGSFTFPAIFTSETNAACCNSCNQSITN